MDVPIRAYRFSDAHLLRISTQIILSFERDLNDFNTFGAINQYTVEYLRHLHAMFEEIPIDEYYEGFKVIKTEEKKKAREKLNSKMSGLMALAALRFGKNSASYRHFGVGKITGLTDEQAQRSCMNVIRCANLYYNELMEIGVSQMMISDLDLCRTELIFCLDEQSFAIRDRDIATEKRIFAGNKLYNELIRYMIVAKMFWKTQNEAKYNDYIMYDESGKSTE